MSSRSLRIRSWWWDYLAIATWLLALLIGFGSATALGRINLRGLASRRGAGDVFVALTTVVPYLVYLVRTEAAPAHATWGKRRNGLTVVCVTGAPPGMRDVLLRNIVKVAPWQLGHMAALRFIHAGDEPPASTVSCSVLSMALLVAVAGPPLIHRRGLHDLLAGTAAVARQLPPTRGNMSENRDTVASEPGELGWPGCAMIPTMILFGLVLGRWWRPTLLLAAIVWPAMLVADGVMDVDARLLPAAGLGVLNAAVGILIHQAVLGLTRLGQRITTR